MLVWVEVKIGMGDLIVVEVFFEEMGKVDFFIFDDVYN